MNNIFARNELLWGKDAQKILSTKHIIVVGLGGVGGYALDSLARSGIENFTIIDYDEVSASNINRQIIALNSTIGTKKTTLFEQRLKDINPNIQLTIIEDFYSEKLNQTIFSKKVDFVVDAIDTMRSKVELLTYCHKNSIPVVTSMGAGNRFDPTKLYLADISEIRDKKTIFTKNILHQLKKNGIEKGIMAVASDEKPIKTQEKLQNDEKIECKNGDIVEFTKISPASTPFVPAVAGYYLSYFVIKKLLNF